MTTLALRPSRRAIQLFIFPALLQSLPTTTAEGSAGRPQNAPVAKVKLRSTSINPLNWSLVRQLCAPPAPRMLPRGCPTAGTAAFQIPREELLCQEMQRRLAQQGWFVLPTGTRSPLLCAPCHRMSWALSGSRLSSTWSWLRHLTEGCWDGGGASGNVPGEHGGHYHPETPPGPSTNPLLVLSPSQMPLRK